MGNKRQQFTGIATTAMTLYLIRTDVTCGTAIDLISDQFSARGRLFA